MKEARRAGIANVLVTNGCVNSKAAADVLDLTDAANIDLKCFSEAAYKKVLGGDLNAVLDFIKTAVDKQVHTELTTLIVPGMNDGAQELDACIEFIAGLSGGSQVRGRPPEHGESPVPGKPPVRGEPVKSQIPWHLSAYHPDWKWDAPATPPSLLKKTAARARSSLSFVYTGNIAGEENRTLCPYCGKSLVNRRGYRIDTAGLSLINEGGKPAYVCKSCGKSAPIRA